MGASFLADNGASINMLKNAGGWKSTSACEGYIDDSLMSKRKIGETMGINVQSRKKPSLGNNDHVHVGQTIGFKQWNKENVAPESSIPLYKNCTFFVAGNGATSSGVSGVKPLTSMAASSSSFSDSNRTARLI